MILVLICLIAIYLLAAMGVLIFCSIMHEAGPDVPEVDLPGPPWVWFSLLSMLWPFLVVIILSGIILALVIHILIELEWYKV